MACLLAARPRAAPRCTKGNAARSFKPASEVSPKRTSSSSPVFGGPTSTSDASTGSVGAKLAPSRSATAHGMPSTSAASAVMAMMPSGMVIASSRQVIDQRRQPNTRSIFRPAPMRAMITTSSLKRSVTSGSRVGRGRSVTCGKRKTIAPIPMHTIGSASGSQATSAINKPVPVRMRTYGSDENEPSVILQRAPVIKASLMYARRHCHPSALLASSPWPTR